ncbi:zinc finger MYM-type protein 1-like [Photinus pyralis]|nr:zinc finger MYM-type protein 1-like [Photinus pyralis]
MGSKRIQYMDHSFQETETVYKDGETGERRKLTKTWFFKKMPNGEKVPREWLCYSPSKKSVYCFCCRLFPGLSSLETAFASKSGFSDWKKLSPRVPNHELNPAHQQSLVLWKQLELRHRTGTTIDRIAEEEIQKEKEKWRNILTRVLDIIRFLSKQNLAFRGHRETDTPDVATNKGNFIELVRLLSKYDPVLREHMLKIDLKAERTSYMSPQIQNELIGLLGDHVRSRILQRVKNAKYFSIIFDSTPDISRLDQTSQVLRYVVVEGDHVSVEESFIEFIDTKDKHAADIASMILEKLKSDGLDIMNCRGQGYDNAAVMKGQHSGVQKRISDVNPKAQFIACSNHSLNLAGIHAAQAEVNSVTFFGTLDRLHSFFSLSTHRWDVLSTTTGTSLKRLVDTRWSSRGEAVKMVKNNFEKILESLEILTGINENADTRATAGGLLVSLQSFTFLTYLGFWEPVLAEVNDAQNYMQQRGLSLRDCASKMKALSDFLDSARENVADTSLSFAESLCTKLGITTEPQRRIRQKKKMPGEEASDSGLSYKNELRREICASVDRIKQEIATRFEQLQDVAQKFEFLSPAILLDEDLSIDLSNAPDDIDRTEFVIERKRLQTFVTASNEKESLKHLGPLELLTFIHQHRLSDSVPNINIMLRIFLTMGVSVATCERSFSKLKLIKNYLRSTMSNLRLNSLAIMSIEHELVDKINFDTIIDDFASRKARRVQL